ncbi:type VII secretion protein EsxU [Mycobacterium sp. Root265]|uniref:WXG100 family type VII secretion target n=1 Tax=Mycobacterium sp. Root265 TaxID=1736504 RepID=UPI00070CF1FF|nr:WXG100 family type VII secretion target [Mycobacterium sp. Root265]KRD16095.1 type VII secretion protein EsxU [Mycobacterium sp. Root265]
MPALNTDLELMHSVAGQIDARNQEVRAMLGTFIGRMCSVPASVWGGAAAVRFREVVDRWNAESLALHNALERIAETVRLNEHTLREAAEGHSHGIGAVSNQL